MAEAAKQRDPKDTAKKENRKKVVSPKPWLLKPDGTPKDIVPEEPAKGRRGGEE